MPLLQSQGEENIGTMSGIDADVARFNYHYNDAPLCAYEKAAFYTSGEAIINSCLLILRLRGKAFIWNSIRFKTTGRASTAIPSNAKAEAGRGGDRFM